MSILPKNKPKIVENWLLSAECKMVLSSRAWSFKTGRLYDMLELKDTDRSELLAVITWTSDLPDPLLLILQLKAVSELHFEVEVELDPSDAPREQSK
jgi:hypothetical protein